MGSTPYVLPVGRPYQPRYLQPEELYYYGLPDATTQPNIMALVDAASVFIDEYTGRTDGNGQGSLVYTTYSERLLMQSPGRNIVRVNFKPMAVVSAATVAQLSASGNYVQGKDPSKNCNYFYTGCQANTVIQTATNTLSPIIAASGRYGYPRRGMQAVYPDLNYGANLLMIASYFGGPPTWTAIDPTAIDYDTTTGEVWLPAGLYLSQYTEVIITYNAGFAPSGPIQNPMIVPGVQPVPRGVKQACVGLMKNFLARGGGTFALQSINSGPVNYTFTEADVDPTIERFLMNYRVVIAY